VSLSEESILAAFEKLFKPGEASVRRFKPSSVRIAANGALAPVPVPPSRVALAQILRQ
jgi:hypothetical protein